MLCLLTPPDASSVDVNLDVVGRVQGLMIVQDEHIAAQRVHTCGVNYGILGNQGTNIYSEYKFIKNKGKNKSYKL